MGAGFLQETAAPLWPCPRQTWRGSEGDCASGDLLHVPRFIGPNIKTTSDAMHPKRLSSAAALRITRSHLSLPTEDGQPTTKSKRLFGDQVKQHLFGFEHGLRRTCKQ